MSAPRDPWIGRMAILVGLVVTFAIGYGVVGKWRPLRRKKPRLGLAPCTRRSSFRIRVPAPSVVWT